MIFFSNPPLASKDQSDFSHPGLAGSRVLSPGPPPKYPREIRDIINNTNTGDTQIPVNRHVVDNFIEALCQIPPDLAASVVKKID